MTINIDPQISKINCFYRLFLFIVILSSFQFAKSQITQPGTLAATSRGSQHTFSIAGPAYLANDVITIKLDITGGHPLTSTSMIADLNNPIPMGSFQIDYFYEKKPYQNSQFDLDAMWNARRRQYINFRKISTQTTLYVTVFNFDLVYRQTEVNYTLTLMPRSSSFECAPCQNNGIASSNCICQNCPFQFSGKICSRLIVQLQKNITIGLTPYNYQYFSISGTDKIVVQIYIQGGVAEAYFQFQTFSGQVANFYNVALGSSDARYVINNNVLKLGADTQQRKFLITIVGVSSVPINASISYTVQNSVSVLVIVMSILGGVLLISLIVAVVCIIKKRNAGNRINSELNIPSDTNKLTSEQIERYFPVCNYSALSNMAQSSLNPINTQQVNKEAATDQDCVICLQQINQADQVRIGYCKHIFHGQCLVSWFKKQRNCPYCRKQYTRDETVNQYNRIVAQNGNKVLKDAQLSKAIFHSRPQSKTIIENIQ